MSRFYEVELMLNVLHGHLLSAASVGVIVSFWGTIIFSLLGAWALKKNVHKVSQEGSSGVDFEWEIMFLGMYLSLWFYGMEERSLALIFQWFCRVPFYIALIWVIGKDRQTISRRELLVALGVVGTSCLSPFYPTVVASGLLWIGVGFAGKQVYKTIKTGDLNGVGIEKQAVYFGSSVFWLGYGGTLANWSIIIWASAYSLVYFIGILAYKHYERQHNELAQRS